MFNWLFGKPNQTGVSQTNTVQFGNAPWASDDSEKVAASFALMSLRNYIISDLKGPRGVHSETALTMIGALAGFSAQHAIRESIVKTGKLPENGVGTAHDDGAFVIVKTESRKTFYFGDLLNSYLVPTSGKLTIFGPGQFTLWGILAAATTQCGAKPLSIEETQEIFRNTATVIGTAQFGEPRLPKDHQSSMTPQRALNRAWPHVQNILSRNDIPGFENRSLKIEYWPTVVAMTAAALLEDAKNVLDPNLSMRIIMEAAIPMSKIDPSTLY